MHMVPALTSLKTASRETLYLTQLLYAEVNNFTQTKERVKSLERGQGRGTSVEAANIEES